MAEKGYDHLYRARPLSRIIQEKVKKPLADELLFGKLAKGGQVIIEVVDGALSFEFQAKEKPPRPGKNGGGKDSGKDSGKDGGGPADPETPSGDKIPELVT